MKKGLFMHNPLDPAVDDVVNGIYKVRIDENNWARCGRCNWLLYERIEDGGKIKIVCSVCKARNMN